MIGEGSGLGGRASAQLLGEPSARVDALDHLAAIESWVGIRPDLGLLDQEIAQVRREKEAAVDRHHYTAAAAQRDKEKQLLAARAAGSKAARKPQLPACR